MRTISQIIDDATITPEIDETFNKIKKELKAPFTPNFFRVWGTSSESLNGIWPVMDHILTSGRVGRRLKEMIFVAISSLKSCHYCEAAHHAFCLHLGLTPAQIQNLIQNYTIDQATSRQSSGARCTTTRTHQVRPCGTRRNGPPHDTQDTATHQGALPLQAGQLGRTPQDLRHQNTTTTKRYNYRAITLMNVIPKLHHSFPRLKLKE